MKIRILNNFLVGVMVVVLTQSCHKKEEVTVAQVNTTILISHGWTLSSLTVDNTDQTTSYAGMTLSFTSGAYETTKGMPIWPANGTWSFSSNDGKTIVRDDGLQIGIDTISDTGLILSFTWTKTTYTSGRAQSISGHYVYTFTK